MLIYWTIETRLSPGRCYRYVMTSLGNSDITYPSLGIDVLCIEIRKRIQKGIPNIYSHLKLHTKDLIMITVRSLRYISNMYVHLCVMSHII